MAIEWGAWDGHLRVGGTVTRDGADALFRWYVGIDGFDYSDTQTLTYTGDDDEPGPKSFTNDLTAGSHSVHQGSVTDYKQVDTIRVTGSPGETVIVTATLGGSHIAGETPHHTLGIALATVPSKPANPTNTSITQSGVKVNLVYPSNGGATISSTRFRIYTALTGGTQVATYTASPAATNHTFTGLTAATTYYAEVAATNAVGTSTASTRVAFTTSALTAPSAPAIAVESSTTTTTSTSTGSAPAANGSTITGYEFQISTDATFATQNAVNSGPGLVSAWTGLTANTEYNVRYRASSNNGYSDWSPTLTFTTSATTPSAPNTLIVTASTATTADLSWTNGNDGGSPITGRDLQVDDTADFSSTVFTATPSGTTQVVTGLTTGVLYYARVRQTTAIGTSSWSAPLSFTLSDDGDFTIHDGSTFVQGQFYFNNLGDWVEIS